MSVLRNCLYLNFAILHLWDASSHCVVWESSKRLKVERNSQSLVGYQYAVSSTQVVWKLSDCSPSHVRWFVHGSLDAISHDLVDVEEAVSINGEQVVERFVHLLSSLEDAKCWRIGCVWDRGRRLDFWHFKVDGWCLRDLDFGRNFWDFRKRSDLDVNALWKACLDGWNVLDRHKIWSWDGLAGDGWRSVADQLAASNAVETKADVLLFDNWLSSNSCLNRRSLRDGLQSCGSRSLKSC